MAGAVDIYSRILMSRSSLGPCKFVLNVGISSYLGLIIALGQEVKGIIKGFFFDLQNNVMLSVVIRIADEVILKSTHNIDLIIKLEISSKT